VKEFVTTARVAVKAGMAGKPMPDGKYEVLTGEKYTVVVDGVKYHRIRALRRFERPFGLPPVEVGDLGGFVAVHRGYLGHEGSCWVADGAFSAGQVTGDAQVTGRAFVGVGSKVTGRSLVSDYAQVVDGAWVQDSLVSDFAQVVGVELNHSSSSVVSTMVFGYSRVAGRARVSGGAKVCRFSQVFGSAVVSGRVQVRDGGVVGGAVVLVSECEVVDLPGGVIDEPLNRWGCPTVVVNRVGDEPVRSVKRFSEPEHGCQLPVAGDGCPVTTFVDDERDAAVEYFNTLIAARKVLGKLRSGAPVAPLNLNLSNPHVVEADTVTGVIETLVNRELAGLVGFETECGKLLDEMNFGSSDKEAVDALMAREAAVPSRAHSRYYPLANDEVGAYSLGFFMGDLVRVETCDGVQFLQVISGGDGVVAVSNITDGSHCTLKIVSELDEDWYDDEEEHYDTYLHLVKPDGSDNRVYVDSFMVLPITHRGLVGEFESIREAQGELLKKFSDGIMERLVGFNETMRHRPDGFVVAITYSEQIELLEDINSLNCDAKRSGDIERLQTLEAQVRALVEGRLESVREAVYDLCGEVSEALVKVATLNAK
jgi:conserved hypothetical protein